MATDTFRRHTRARVDAAVHRVFRAFRHNSAQHCFLWRLLRVVQARSDLMATAPSARGTVAHVDALQNLVRFERALVREPEEWSGATGHPLVVVASLANHLFGRYPTPRFLASVWFDTWPQRHSWFVEHACGRRFRSLDVPIAMTRRMEHIFLQTPDHVPVSPALRRAEVLGLGSSPELAEVVLTTELAYRFLERDRWRAALTWLVGCGDSVELTQVRPLVDYLDQNPLDLRGRTFASVMRLVRDWHGWLGSHRGFFVSWPRSRWNSLVVPVAPNEHEPRAAEWAITELLDSHALAQEGRAMRHCVATYGHACVARTSSIWSLRHRWADQGAARSVLTIEVRPDSATIVQVRGKANTAPTGSPLELVRRWAAREGLRFHRSVAIADGAELPHVA